jgi:hypothetical protein
MRRQQQAHDVQARLAAHRRQHAGKARGGLAVAFGAHFGIATISIFLQ